MSEKNTKFVFSNINKHRDEIGYFHRGASFKVGLLFVFQILSDGLD